MPSAVRKPPAPQPSPSLAGEVPGALRRLVPAPDFAVLAAYLVLDLLFGRPFAKLGLGERALYVTEPVLVLTAALALRRVGWSGAVERVRRALPLILLLVVWLAGAIATARGLISFGFKKTTYDVGLFEYTVMLALIPVVVDTREKALALLRILAGAGFGAAVVYVILRWSGTSWGNENVGPALGMFIACAPAYVAAQALHGQRVPWWMWAASLFSITVMSYVAVRAVWAGMLVMVVAAAVLAPRRWWLVGLAGAVAFMFSNVATKALDRGYDLVHPDARSGAATSVAMVGPRGFVADDGMPEFGGGRAPGRGDAFSGELSRELRAGEYIDLPALTGLVPGQNYAVRLRVEPRGTREVAGRVGDTSGSGWSAAPWRVRGDGWRPVVARLTASTAQERLVVILDKGAARVDALEVRPAPAAEKPVETSSEKPVETSSEKPTETPPAGTPPAEEEPSGGGFLSQTTGTFRSQKGDPSFENTRWRLDIWSFMLERAARQPFFGVGFGRPTNFRWRQGLGGLYDARTGAPSMQDVTGPHNSFVNIMFRTGLSGTIPLLILFFLTIRSAVRALRRRDDSLGRAATFMLAVLLVNATVNAALSVALEGPHMGVFFWSLVALLLVTPNLPRTQHG